MSMYYFIEEKSSDTSKGYDLPDHITTDTDALNWFVQHMREVCYGTPSLDIMPTDGYIAKATPWDKDWPRWFLKGHKHVV